MQSKLLERLPGDQGRMGGSDLTSDADRLVENTLHRVRAILSSLLVLEYQRQEGRRTLLVLNHESGTDGDAVLKRDILHAALLSRSCFLCFCLRSLVAPNRVSESTRTVGAAIDLERVRDASGTRAGSPQMRRALSSPIPRAGPS
jgi:hypothetical protein